MRAAALALGLLLTSACSGGRAGETWDGTVIRGFGEPIPWTGHVFYQTPSWEGYLENRFYGAGGWIEDPDEGPLFAQAVIEVHSTAGMTSTPPQPLSTGDTIPILHLGQDRGDAEWWAHASWIEQGVDGEIAMRYVFNNTGGLVDGSLTFTDVGEDEDAETYWWAGEVDLTIDMDSDDGEYPGYRELDYTLRWGPYTEDGY